MSKPSVANTRGLGQTKRKVERPEDDNYPTPPAAVRALLSRERLIYRPWDCFAGAGVLAAVLRDELPVTPPICTTLNDYGDQFRLGICSGLDITRIKHPPLDAGCIVSNPAYGLVKENDAAIINKLLDFGFDKVCLLMDAAFLEAEGRFRTVFSKRPPARVYSFVDRVTMIPHRLYEGKNDPEFDAGGTTAYAWFVWERKHTGPGYFGDWLVAGDFEDFDDLERYQVDCRAHAQARRLL